MCNINDRLKTTSDVNLYAKLPRGIALEHQFCMRFYANFINKRQARSQNLVSGGVLGIEGGVPFEKLGVIYVNLYAISRKWIGLRGRQPSIVGLRAIDPPFSGYVPESILIYILCRIRSS